MASPVDSARVGTNITTAGTGPHAINVGSPVAGTLLIVMVRFAGAPGTVTFTGYTPLVNGDASDASDDVTYIYYRWADGTEGVSDNLSNTSSQKLAAICWEITGAENPATTAPSVSSVVVGTAANINPGAVLAPGSTLTLDYLISGGGTVGIGVSTANTQRGMSFLATQAVVAKVVLNLKKTGTPTDNLIVEIRTDDGAGLPSSTVVGSSVSLANSTLTTSFVAYTFNVVAPVSASSKYHIVLARSGAIDASNYPEHGWGNTLYTSGGIERFDGSVWVSVSAVDMEFQVYEMTAIPDILFLAVIGLDSETATATQPAGYSNLANANSGTGGAVATNCMIWGASKAATAASEDPGAWTSSAPNAGVSAWTIAIPAPAAAAAPGPAAAMFKSPLRRRASRYLTFR